ncbi:hypothetical protein K439DRAFT_1620248 [Ramaria rubella]|nr:hypothetical protein K439DRAFT_1620248 [Ramaria rubella]
MYQNKSSTSSGAEGGYQGCGAVYANMPGMCCGACELISTNVTVPDAIMESMTTHQSQAMGFCINQMHQPAKQQLNKGLKNVAQACALNQTLKDASKTPSICIEGQLWIYSKNSSKEKPASYSSCITIKHPGSRHTTIFTLPAREALQGFFDILCKNYQAVPDKDIVMHEKILASIERYGSEITVLVIKDNSNSCPLVLDDYDITICTLHTRLTQSDNILKKDATGNRIMLRMYAWASQTGVKHGREDSDEDEDEEDTNSFPPSKRQSISSSSSPVPTSMHNL